MNYWLSVLVPTKYPNKFKTFYESLSKNCNDKNGIELVILEDGPSKQVKRVDGTNYFDHTQLTFPAGATRSEQLEYCIENARGEFVWFANDDITCETLAWDRIFRETIKKFDDKFILAWPNDLFFRSRLSIFPLLRKGIAKQLFPLPYQRYKIDDTIFDIFPPSRKVFMENVVMRHGDGKTYACEPNSYQHDEREYVQRTQQRASIRGQIRGQISDYKNVKIFLAVPRGKHPACNEFYDHYFILDRPDNTTASFCSGQSPAKNRNIMIDQAREQKCTHIMFLDDDVVYNSDLIFRLLDKNVDVVTALYLKRDYPHEPIIFDYVQADGYGSYRKMKSDDPEMIEVEQCGLGACLIKMSVFDHMDKFYEGKAKPYVRLGEIEADNWCDDTGFFQRMKKSGIKIYCDTTALVGHYANMIIYPNKEGDNWTVIYKTNAPGAVQFKMPWSI